MGFNKSAIAGIILTASAVVLSACTTHRVSHPRYRDVGPAHHHSKTVVRPPARHRTVIVQPPARHRTVIVRPPARHRTVIVRPPARHRTVIVKPPRRDGRHVTRRYRHRDAARITKHRHNRKYRHKRGERIRGRYEAAKPPVKYRSGRVGSSRDPRRMRRSRPIEGHISSGRPGRPDVVMPKTRPRDKQSSRYSARKHRRSKKRDDDRRSKRDDDDRRNRDKGD